MEIATGGVVPDGADAVVPIEHVTEQDGAVDVPVGVSSGDEYPPARRGRALRRAGADDGSVAHASADRGARRRRRRGAALRQAPRIAIVTTGHRAARARGGARRRRDLRVERGDARRAARTTRHRARRETSPTTRPPRHALAAGSTADVLVTSGGVSVGPHDLVRGSSPSSAPRRSSRASRCVPEADPRRPRRARSCWASREPVSSLVGALLFVARLFAPCRGRRPGAPVRARTLAVGRRRTADPVGTTTSALVSSSTGPSLLC